MHLVDDIHLVFSFRRGIGHLVHDLADVVHAVVGSRVDLDHIHAGSRRYGPAASALPAGRAVNRVLAVDGFRKNLRYGCLSGSSCPAEQIGVSDPFRPDLILQRRNNVVLPFHVLKTFRAKFTVKSCIRHIFSRFCPVLIAEADAKHLGFLHNGGIGIHHLQFSGHILQRHLHDLPVPVSDHEAILALQDQLTRF